MKIALSVWKDQIPTVFDVSEHLIVFEQASDGTLLRTTAKLTSLDGPMRAQQLERLGINVLICGAISRMQEHFITARGITVFPFVRGTVTEVWSAYMDDRLEEGRFVLPGCHGQRRRGRHKRCHRWGVLEE